MFDPIMIYGFSIVHLVFPTVALGLIFPGWFNFVIPSEKIPLGTKPVMPMEIINATQDQTITRAISEEDGEAYYQPELETKEAR